MTLSAKINLLAKWVALSHDGQLIRCSGRPYFDHLLAVAEKAAVYIPLGYELGLCHDLLEKTSVTAAELGEKLLIFGYSANDAAYITAIVLELTDVYTKAGYPDLSKKERKEKEAMRLTKISAGAQTLKYADLDDNIRWMLQYDLAHAAGYLDRKHDLLANMNAGDSLLRKQVLDLTEKSLRELTA